MKDAPADTVVLRAQKSRASIPLLRLVIGGVAARLRVGVDQLDDLQLAVETLIVEERSYEGDLVLEISTMERGLCLRLEGLRNQDVMARLRNPAAARAADSQLIDVCMLLDSLVDVYSVDDEEGEGFVVQLEKWTS